MLVRVGFSTTNLWKIYNLNSEAKQTAFGFGMFHLCPAPQHVQYNSATTENLTSNKSKLTSVHTGYSLWLCVFFPFCTLSCHYANNITQQNSCRFSIHPVLVTKYFEFPKS